MLMVNISSTSWSHFPDDTHVLTAWVEYSFFSFLYFAWLEEISSFWGKDTEGKWEARVNSQNRTNEGDTNEMRTKVCKNNMKLLRDIHFITYSIIVTSIRSFIL